VGALPLAVGEALRLAELRATAVSGVSREGSGVAGACVE